MLFETALITWLLADQAPSMGASVIVSELSDLLNATGISARQAAEKADDLGVDLPYGTIAAYWAGKHPRKPSEKTLQGLSEVTSIPLRRLRRSAGAAGGEAQPWTPPAEANRLTQRQRQAIEQLIKTIVEAPAFDSGEAASAGASGEADQDQEVLDHPKVGDILDRPLLPGGIVIPPKNKRGRRPK